MKHISHYIFPIVTEAAFREAMTAAGFASRDPVIADGLVHRFRVEATSPAQKTDGISFFLAACHSALLEAGRNRESNINGA